MVILGSKISRLCIFKTDNASSKIFGKISNISLKQIFKRYDIPINATPKLRIVFKKIQKICHSI